MSISDKRIYLASRSPRRRDLLKQIGVPFELLLLREDLRRGADVDETPLADESPGVYVLRIARTKVEMAARQIAYRVLPQKPVLAADIAHRHHFDEGDVHASPMRPFRQRDKLVFVHVFERDGIDLDREPGVLRGVDAFEHALQIATAR